MSIATGANAAMSDAVDGNWSGQLDFNGTITDSNPVWQFQIMDDTQQLYTDIDLQSGAGVINQDETVTWKLDDGEVHSLLEGNMKQSAATGGADLFPVVKVTAASGDVELVSGAADATNVTLDVTGSDSAAIKVSLSRDDLVTYKDSNDAEQAFTNAASIPANLSALIQSVNGAVDPASATATTGGGNATTIYTTEDNTIITGALGLSIQNATLTAASLTDYPETWSATMPVTITMQ
nr:hypothetical protein [Vibrio vulnificus]